MFDYTQELPLEIEYLIDSGYKEAYIYKINHKDKTLTTYKFSCLMAIRDYIMENKIESVIFYGIGSLALLYNELKERFFVNYSTDRKIYQWRMFNLSSNERNRTTPLYYYEVQGYKYSDK